MYTLTSSRNSVLLPRIVLVLLLFFTLLPVVYTEEDYTPTELSLDVYADGVAFIEYTLDVNPTLLRINVSLPGEGYEDIIIRDQDGSLLDFAIIDGHITIDVLGSISVDVEYSTPDLTNKTKSLWTLCLSAPLKTNIQLPEGATIMGLNPTPLTISFIDNRALLTMPPNQIEVSYLLGTIGTREHALVLINEAEATIENLKAKEIHVNEAESILQQARALYDKAQYSRAEQLATQAKDMASEIGMYVQEAQYIIEQADSAISSAQSERRTSQIDQAREEVQQAREAYTSGAYVEARSLAEQAVMTAQQSRSTASFLSPQVVTLIGVAALVIAVVLLKYVSKAPRDKPSRPESDEREFSIDINPIFEEHPDLRPDDREVIMYISEAPKGAFAFELRNRLDIPKSSAWRMIRRLEQMGIVETSTVGRETLVQISSRYRAGKG
jgi:uncharacterized membrane protein